jgi:alanyl-tRNA synthetase
VLQVGKQVAEEQKKRQKAESSTALKTVQTFFEKNPDKKVFVGHLGIPSANTKAVVDVLNFYSKAKKPEDKARSVYVFAGSKDQGVAHGVYVADVLEGQGVTPDAWTGVVTGVIGGKAGGKGSSRQGAGAHPERLDDAVDEALNYITEKLKDLHL